MTALPKIKQHILRLARQFGYVVLQVNAFTKKAKETETPAIQQEWLEGVVLIKDRYAVLERLPKAHTIAEIGVGYGDFSKILIETLQPEQFIAIDTFDGVAGDKWGEPLQKSGLSHLEYYLKNTSTAAAQCDITAMHGFSWEKIDELEDDTFDFMYIDADHCYASVKKDITAASTKIRIGGYMQCNDFTHFDTHNLVHYGVPRAVFELLAMGTYKMRYLCLATNGFYDVVLQRIA